MDVTKLGIEKMPMPYDTLSEHYQKAVDSVVPYLQKRISEALNGELDSWYYIAKALVDIQADVDLRRIRDAYLHSTLSAYIRDKSLQRKSNNALETVSTVYTILTKVVPVDNSFMSSLEMYMTTDASKFLINIGEDINQFLLWLDYRSIGGEFARKLKKKTYQELRNNITTKGDIYYLHLLTRALMAYKSVVERTQFMCDKCGIESGMDEAKRLAELRDKRLQEKKSNVKCEQPSVYNKSNSFATLGDIMHESLLKKQEKKHGRRH